MEQRKEIAPASEPLADASDMFAVHTMFRREFGLPPALVRNVLADEYKRGTAQVASIVDFGMLMYEALPGVIDSIVAQMPSDMKRDALPEFLERFLRLVS